MLAVFRTEVFVADVDYQIQCLRAIGLPQAMSVKLPLPGTSNSQIGLSRDRETSEVIIGGTGRRVIGRIRAVPGNVVIDWSLDLQRLVRLVPDLSRPKEQEFADPTTYFEALGNYNTAEAKFYLAVSPDGSFVVDDVPAGDYRLELLRSIERGTVHEHGPGNWLVKKSGHHSRTLG